MPLGLDTLQQAYYRPFEVSTNFTRPANTTAYAQYDAISNSTSSPTILTFSSVGASNGQTVMLTEIEIISSAAQATLPEFNLWLLNETTTATNDNSALDITDADRDHGQTALKIDNKFKNASNSRVNTLSIAKQIKLASDSQDLYGLLQANNAYTPISGEIFHIILRGYRMY